MNRAQLYHDMTTSELKSKYDNLKNELFNLRFQNATGQLRNPLAINIVKKDIARVMTILKEREYALPKNPGKKKATTKKAIKEESKEDKKPATKKAVVKKDGGSK